MTENEKQADNQTRRQKIAERYKGIDPSMLEVIPAEMDESINIAEQKLKVAAYVRVSTENDEQKSSFELQSNDFTNRINANPNWEFMGVYADGGILQLGEWLPLPKRGVICIDRLFVRNCSGSRIVLHSSETACPICNGTGLCELDDVLNNGLGGCIGYVMESNLERVMKKTQTRVNGFAE